MGQDKRRILIIGAAEVLPEAQVEPIREAFTKSNYDVHMEAAVFSQAASTAHQTRPHVVIVCASSVEPGGVGLRLARFIRRLPAVSGRAPVLLASSDARLNSLSEAVPRAGVADGTIALPQLSSDAIVSAVEHAVSAGPVPSTRKRWILEWLPSIGVALVFAVLSVGMFDGSLPEPMRHLVGYPVRPAVALLGGGLLTVGSAFHVRDQASVRRRASSLLSLAIGVAFLALTVFGLLKS